MKKIKRLGYSVHEFSAATGVCTDVIYEEIRRGNIPHLKWGRRLVIPISALKSLMKSPTQADENERNGEPQETEQRRPHGTPSFFR